MGDISFQNNTPDSLLSGKELPSYKFELEKSKGKVIGNSFGKEATVEQLPILFACTLRQLNSLCQLCTASTLQGGARFLVSMLRRELGLLRVFSCSPILVIGKHLYFDNRVRAAASAVRHANKIRGGFTIPSVFQSSECTARQTLEPKAEAHAHSAPMSKGDGSATGG